MLITNGDRLKHHFKNVVDVKHFTPEEICTIIDTFSIELPEESEMIIPGESKIPIVYPTIKMVMDFKTTKICEAESEG